jgi:phosphatidylserine/phosphatidylglycerophosphate/cardiolipin synthase-like enzyme
MKRDAQHIPFVESASYPIRAGNHVNPLVDGVPAFSRICEAVESAKHSVWVTIAFLDPEFQMPGGQGSLFDVLDRASERDLDVRVIFWRSRPLHDNEPGTHFFGTQEERSWLGERKSQFLARWDCAHGRYCQHQKSWLIDAGKAGEVAFVGGINLNQASVVTPGHAPTDRGNTHDVYVELQGPSATDVHHNFVQRWNESSERGAEDGSWPPDGSDDDLQFPIEMSPESGDAVIQIQRTVRNERYSNGTPTPGGKVFDIAAGEYSVLAQYLQAINSAQRTIYIEDQAIGAPRIVEALGAALKRGVDVVFLVPVDPHPEMAMARKMPESKAFFDALGALDQFDHFALVGITTQRPDGEYQHVYVHAKIALIDDAWCTIGSANIGNRSFYGDTELNASIWHAETVRKLRCDLLEEHLAEDTRMLNDREALAVYRRIARDNALCKSNGEPLQGLAFALDPKTYGS